MDIINRFAHTRITTCCISFALAISWSLPVWADSRQDALAELDRLRQSSAVLNISDEMKSADATFAIAEHYSQANDFEQAERFYLLAIQKVRIILATAPPIPADSVSSTAVEQSTPAAIDLPAPGLTVTIPEMPEKTTPVTAGEVMPPSSPAVAQEMTVPSFEQTTDEYFSEDITSDKLVGTASSYSVVKGDTIRLIAAKLGVNHRYLIKVNKLDDKAYLKIGQKLLYNNRKIVPQRMNNGIVVNIPDRTLYYFRKGKLTISLPVALGVAIKSEKYDWKTPTGKFKITAKMKDPTWNVPPSIQSEMEDQGKEVITKILPGASNPLGKFAIKTSIPGILIHSTTKPWSIYSFASHGCIRVYPEQMEEFYKEVRVNTPGEIIYKPVKLAVTEEGRIFLEVHRDVYNKSNGLAAETRRLIEKQKLAGQVNWKKVDSIVKLKSGIAEDISL
jgi:lipoprotein-anchoring transpeptidase ErfK/SrfK